MTEKEPRKSRIPEFASREEEAEFWDTHDLADYWDEFKPVQVTVAKKLAARISIDLEPEDWKILRSMAREKGVSPITLAQTWIMEHLKEPQLSLERCDIFSSAGRNCTSGLAADSLPAWERGRR
jgi:CopG antitoxin of type II toxin-antitoxin system